MARRKIVVFTGAGMSAESGLPTFRGADGLWRNHSVYDVASPDAWQRDQQLVLDFYNERRTMLRAAEPNAAHLALVELESHFDVSVVTQNVDDLHERAGSTQVLHLHGQLMQARSSIDESLIYALGDNNISLGDVCEHGSQLRPNIVWFGEAIHNSDLACARISDADIFLVIGTSLSVYPAAGFIDFAVKAEEKLIVAPELDNLPKDFQWLQGTAVAQVPKLLARWLEAETS